MASLCIASFVTAVFNAVKLFFIHHDKVAPEVSGKKLGQGEVYLKPFHIYPRVYLVHQCYRSIVLAIFASFFRVLRLRLKCYTGPGYSRKSACVQLQAESRELPPRLSSQPLSITSYRSMLFVICFLHFFSSIASAHTSDPYSRMEFVVASRSRLTVVLGPRMLAISRRSIRRRLFAYAISVSPVIQLLVHVSPRFFAANFVINVCWSTFIGMMVIDMRFLTPRSPTAIQG